MSISSPAFSRLVAALKHQKKTCTVIESSCGGLINASILAQPGASAVYFGGSVAYNTRRAKPLLLNDSALHDTLMTAPLLSSGKNNAESEKEKYVRSKLEWTRQTAIAFCQQLDTDICIAEGGATGPTFRPQGLFHGFCTIAIAAKQADGQVKMVDQVVVESSHANREANMRFFADRAAEIAQRAVVVGGREETDETPSNNNNNADAPNAHVDRATHLRGDAKQLQHLAEDAQYVVLHGGSALFRVRQESQDETNLHNRELMLLSATELDSLCHRLGANARRETTFLGLVNDTEPVFGVDLLMENGDIKLDTTSLIEQVLSDVLQGQETGNDRCLFEDTRTVAPLLDPNTCHNELVLHATALAQWQRRAPFCAICGSPTILVEGGTSRTCTGCGNQSWPRQDPSMIAVVSNRDGSKILLGRSKRHPAKMYTALAGFVEAGETMERAVAREVFEETGIRVDTDSVNYQASQPWPFPQSTMIGFTVKADENQTLNIDTNELVDAAWFDKSQVQMASTVMGPVMQEEVADAALASNPDLQLLIPPKGVLARLLVDKWLQS